MVQPCVVCIVNSMCKDPCDPFIKYVDEMRGDYITGTSKFIATQLRSGNAKFGKDGLAIYYDSYRTRGYSNE